MKQFFLALTLVASLFIIGCNGCCGPNDVPPVDPNDTTVVDTVRDTIPTDTLPADSL